MMIRRATYALLCVGMLMPTVSWAAEPMKAALAVIPGDAIAFVCVPNIEELDARLQQSVSSLGLTGMVPPEAVTLAGTLSTQFRMTAGLDTKGSLVVVAMPAPGVFELTTKIAVLVPTTDGAALLKAVDAEEGENGVWTAMLMPGPPMSAIVKGKHVIFSQDLATCKAVAGAESSIAKRIKPSDAKMLEGRDIALWVDSEVLIPMVKPMLDPLLGMAMAGAAAQNPLQAKQMEASMAQLDMMMKGMSSFSVGISLEQSGLGLRFGLTCKPKSELAKQMKLRPTSGSLLAGVPGEKYMIAFGENIDPEAMKAGVDQIDTYFALPEDAQTEINSQALVELKDTLKQLLLPVTNMRGSVIALTPGPGGIFAMSLFIDTSDSAKWTELAGKALSSALKIPVDPDIKKALEAVNHIAEAEKIAGINVQHVKLDLSTIDVIGEEDLETVYKLIGKEGVLFRMAAVDAKTVAMSFGGGAEHMGRLISSAQKEDDSLAKSAGILHVASQLPKSRAAVAYVAVDQILDCVREGAKLLGEGDIFPIQIPPLEAPLAMTSTGGDGWGQFDLFIPMELIVAGKDAAMMLMGGGAIPPHQGAPVPAH